MIWCLRPRSAMQHAVLTVGRVDAFAIGKGGSLRSQGPRFTVLTSALWMITILSQECNEDGPMSSATTQGPSFDRRTVLWGAAALMPLTLTACDGMFVNEPSPSDPPPRTPVRLELTPLEAVQGLRAPTPVFQGSVAASPSSTRPLSLLIFTEENQDAELRCTTVAAPKGALIPTSPHMKSGIIDDSRDVLRIYARSVDGVNQSTTMVTSSDLQKWSSVEIETDIAENAAAADGGLVVSDPIEGEVFVWSIAEDGIVTELSAVAIPDGEEWAVWSIARRDEIVVVVVAVSKEGQDDTPSTIRSADGGSSWSAPVPLPTSDSSTTARAVRVQGENFVITGSHVVPSKIFEGDSFQRMTAWSSADGAVFVQEDVPLPVWGLEDSAFQRGDREIVLTTSTPIDFKDIDLGASVVSSDRSEPHVLVYHDFDVRTATRAADGAWSVTEFESIAPEWVRGGAADSTGKIFVTRTTVFSRKSGSEVDMHGLKVSRTIDSRGSQLSLSGRPSGLHVISEMPMLDQDPRALDSFLHEDLQAVMGMQFTQTEIQINLKLPTDLDAATQLSLVNVDEETAICYGRRVDEYRLPTTGVKVWTSSDGSTWNLGDGLPTETDCRIGTPVRIQDRIMIPVSEWTYPDESLSVLEPRIFRSEDGVTWHSISVDPSTWEQSGLEGGAHIADIAASGEGVIGVGYTRDAAGTNRAATFVVEEESISVHVLEREEMGTELSGITTVNSEGRSMLYGLEDPVEMTIAADGTASGDRANSEQEFRNLPFDLGSGALLATGYVDQPGTAIGACIWASRDGGQNWDPTMLPSAEGGFPSVTMVRDQDDVVVLVSLSDGPVGHRISGARSHVLGTGNQQTVDASDGGSG